MNKKNEKDPVVKSVVRNTTVKVNKKNTVADNFSMQATQRCNSNVGQPKYKGILKTSSSNVNKFANPECHSTKSITKKIECLDQESQKITNICPDKTMIDKAPKVPNFHFNNSLYKDLMNFNLYEEQKLQRSKGQSSHRKFTPSTHSKDLEPVVKDFQEEIEKLDKPIMVSAVRVKCSSQYVYDSHDLYNKINSWKSD